jgi:muramoyltetrapeptide carboxypeptidase
VSRSTEPSAVVPDPLGAGAVVRVVAPAGPFEPALMWRALGWLSERYRVRHDRDLFARRGYLAGDDAARARALGAALAEPDVAAILCARGGYGALRFAARIDWEALRRRPRWLVGFSDVTALHVEAARVGVASLHAPNAASLGRGDAEARAAFVAALETPRARRTWSTLRALEPGRARGCLAGGNLTLLHACAAAGRLRLPPGCILLIEDIGERPYRIDRMLTTLALGGHLAGVVGVVVGELVDCSPGPDGVRAEEALADCLAPLGVPVALGAPFGHGRRNDPIVLGAPAELVCAGAGTAELVVFG